MNKKLKIVSCNDNKKWYADLVGQFVPFLGKDDEYKSVQPSGYTNFISLEDAVEYDSTS